MTTIVLADFLNTSTFNKNLSDIEAILPEDTLSLVLKNNKGGSISKGKLFLKALYNCKAKVDFIVKESAISAAAFVWMCIHIEQLRGNFKNVTLSIDPKEVVLIYHKPFLFENGVRLYLEDAKKDAKTTTRMKEEVELLDTCFHTFLDMFPHLEINPENATKEDYTREEINTLYQNNHDIHITLRG